MIITATASSSTTRTRTTTTTTTTTRLELIFRFFGSWLRCSTVAKWNGCNNHFKVWKHQTSMPTHLVEFSRVSPSLLFSLSLSLSLTLSLSSLSLSLSHTHAHKHTHSVSHSNRKKGLKRPLRNNQWTKEIYFYWSTWYWFITQCFCLWRFIVTRSWICFDSSRLYGKENQKVIFCNFWSLTV